MRGALIVATWLCSGLCSGDALADTTIPVLGTSHFGQKARSPHAWVELELRAADGSAIAGARYRVVAPDGGVFEGRLDRRGFARVENIKKRGTCQITFPDYPEAVHVSATSSHDASP